MRINDMANLNSLYGGYKDTDNEYNNDIIGFDLSIYKRVEKISLDDVNIQETLGKGSFGVVNRAEWNGKVVAVKKAEGQSEKKAFMNEVHHLARASHKNIIHLFGITISTHAYYIIMEYADGGSLYQFLHNQPFQKYNVINALSWLMQCARAIDYLHSYQPKAIIHRDLKSLNMLLKNGKSILKICDFGTACDQRTDMTEDKGSVAWMAPEVMNGEKYDEKCDVYSYGMFIWEILTRRIPGSEFTHKLRMVYKVLNNWRPPLIKGCPNIIQDLMQRCWHCEFKGRPGMDEVLQIVTRLFRFASGGEEPAEYISSSESLTESRNANMDESNSEGQTSHDVSEFPTDSTADIHGNMHGSKKPELLPPESNRSSFMGFEDDGHPQRPIRESEPIQEEDQYEPIAYFKAEPAHVPRPVFRDKCPSNLSQEMLLPLNINIPDGELPERNDLFLSMPKTSKMDVKISPRPSTIFPTNYPTVNYNPSRFVPLSGQATNQAGFLGASPSRCDSCHSPIADVTNCFARRINLDSGYYNNVGPQMRHHDVPRDPLAVLRRRSAEVAHVQGHQTYGHRRSSSYESGSLIGFQPLEIEVNSRLEREQHPWSNNLQLPADQPNARSIGYREPGPKPGDRNHQLKNMPPLPAKDYWPMVATPKADTSASELGDLWQYLDEELKPAKAIPSCPQSQKIYENHKDMAHDLLVVQEKIFYLNQSKNDLVGFLRKQEVNHKSSKQRYHTRITDLEQTNQKLRQRQHDLKRDLEQIQAKRRQQSHRTKPDTSYDRHSEHLHHQPEASAQSYQNQYSQHHSQGQTGHTPYCKCYENVQPPQQSLRDTYGNNAASAQSQSHISHCSYHDSYYRH